MNGIRGYYRLCISCLVLAMFAMFIFLTSYFPVKVGRYTLPHWGANTMCRVLLWILHVRIECAEKEKIRHLNGLLFPNHIGYLDVLVLEAITPTRFLAKAAIRSWPFIGQAATGIGCVYVKRRDKDSRHQAKEALAAAERFPPITLFPEGKRGPGTELLPFRYGAFDIAAQTTTPYLPVALVYDNLEAAIWRRGTNIFKAVWQLAARPRRLTVTVIPLTAVSPTPADDPAQLAEAAHVEMNAVLTEKQYRHALPLRAES
jgi:1-acyl-sn-glycerol-3-phosphate acyltransferase